MANPNRSRSNARKMLRELPARIFLFLTVLSSYKHIRDALFPRGYTAQAHNRFWLVFLRFAQFSQVETSLKSAETEAATVAIAAWQLPTIRVATVALKFEFPEQYQLVFSGLTPVQGSGAIVSVAMLLDRFDQLENDPQRAASREVDHQALAKLAERGITPEVRQRMRAHLVLATHASQLDPSLAQAAVPEIRDPTADERAAALECARALYEEWSEVARVEITSRADLIRLGLAKRRRAGKSAEPAPEVAALPVAPPVEAVPLAPSAAPTVDASAPSKPTNGAGAGSTPLFGTPEGSLPPVA